MRRTHMPEVVEKPASNAAPAEHGAYLRPYTRWTALRMWQ